MVTVKKDRISSLSLFEDLNPFQAINKDSLMKN
jgi:hypothetical protein